MKSRQILVKGIAELAIAVVSFINFGSFAVWGETVGRAGVLLASRGEQTAAPVVIRAEATPTERYAASEYVKWTQKLTGVEPKILTDDQTLPRKAVLLGLNEHTLKILPAAAESTQALGMEGFRLVLVGERLVILGSTVRGITYGVHEMLNVYGGIEWFAPWRTYIPKNGALEIPDKLDRTEKPAVEIRDEVTFELRTDHEFALKMRINGFHHGFAEHLGPSPYMYDGSLPWAHTLPLIIKPDQYKATHPEYFAMDGKGNRQFGPGYQLCCSNPDVVRIVTDYVLNVARRRPDIRYFGVSQNDGSTGPQQCHCPNCRAIDEREGCWGASTLQLVNAVAEAVEKVRPDATVTTLAYRYTQKPPKTIRPRANVMPLFCSVDCDFSKPIGECDFKVNREFLADLEGWRKLSTGNGFLLWDYPMNYMRVLLPFPCIRATADNIRRYINSGVRGFYLECCKQRSAEFSELKSWLLPKLMWNPNQPLDPLVEKFMNGCYGRLGPYMLEYVEALKKMDRKGLKRALQIEMRHDDPAITPAIVEEITSIWARAREEFPRGEPAKLARRLGAPADYVAVFRQPLANLTGKDDPTFPTRFAAVQERAKALLALQEDEKAFYSEGNTPIGGREMPYVKGFVAMTPPSAEAQTSVELDDWVFENNDWWGHKLVDDSSANGGKAHHYWGVWCGYFRFYQLMLKKKASCEISFRAKLPKGSPKSGAVMEFLPVDSRDFSKTLAPLLLDASDLSEDEYRWVTVGTIPVEYWTHLRMNAHGNGAILDAIRVKTR